MLKKINDFISGYIAILVVLCAIFALIVPEFVTGLIKTSWVSYILGMVMFGMGLTISVDDFKELFVNPKFLIIGILSQFLIMPLLAFALIKIFNLPLGLTIGVILVGTCPGGTSSNIITYLSKGDVALSVGITSCTTLLAPFLTPFLTNLLIGHSISIDLISMFFSIIKIVIVPITLGIFFHKFLPKITSFLKNILPMSSSVGVAVIVMVIVATNASNIISNFGIIVIVVVLHNLFGCLFGFLVGKMTTKDFSKTKALSIEVGMQNSGLAASLALTHFASYPLAAVPGALFSVWHNISGGILASIYSKI